MSGDKQPRRELPIECRETNPAEHPLMKKLRDLGWDESDSELKTKAEEVVQFVVSRIKVRKKEGVALQPKDAEEIQKHVEGNLTNEDLKRMGQLSFPQWFTENRLPSYEQIKEGVGVSHLILANEKMGEHISSSDKENLSVLDLGSGTLGTIVKVAQQAESGGKKINFTGVDYTSKLVEVSRQNAKNLTQDMPSMSVKINESDIESFVDKAIQEGKNFDNVTASYVLHHLKKVNQKKLIGKIFELIESGGSLQVADPQEGKSQFNLEVLLPNEPEGVFAEFTSPEEMEGWMKDAGFQTEIILRDDPHHPDNQGYTKNNYTGYLVRGIKQL